MIMFSVCADPCFRLMKPGGLTQLHYRALAHYSYSSSVLVVVVFGFTFSISSRFYENRVYRLG